MSLLNKIKDNKWLEEEDLLAILSSNDKGLEKALQENAKATCEKYYGKNIYIRGLIEYSNICRKNCYYCGIQSENTNIKRYRLSQNELYNTIEKAYELGFRTFVLQGGEDPKLTDDYFVNTILKTKENFPETRITLSIGERTKKSLKRMKEAGADRFLLRFETSSAKHFEKLHPENDSLEKRLAMLQDLRDLDFIVGTGFMIGSPGQTLQDLAQDLLLVQRIQPEMIGVGPFIPHKNTRFKNFKEGELGLSLKILSLLRLMNPKALIPSTTALNTINQKGRILGILHGANVLMPNVSPNIAKENYNLYDSKKSTGLESGEFLESLDKELKTIGRQIIVDVGDPLVRSSNEIYRR